MLKRYNESRPTVNSAGAFDVIPAIDLRAGRVVRLREGDFERETIFDPDPVAVARGFAAAGARWIHVVDLDGARAGERRQAGIVGAIRAGLPSTIRLQVAGGLRSANAIAAALETADRVLVGTALIRDPASVRGLVKGVGPERLLAALDVRDGRVVGEGWRPDAQAISVDEARDRVADAGVSIVAVTAIARDGGLGGPDLELLGWFARDPAFRVLASGGIRSLADLESVRAVGCVGAIVGRALYEGVLDLGEALAAFD